ncbi:alternative oxidase, mitochondrial-like isoform X2 [Asterias rubens]|uniref:alternative oxidase, mitochondrial-like isoform X2 n=1 Tax=Asterias rubens TaxID=7604 RepID=UPI001454E4BE|nr:alternative oxidase, mitochondrial-like isoform X2 [Asterias rubens]
MLPLTSKSLLPSSITRVIHVGAVNLSCESGRLATRKFLCVISTGSHHTPSVVSFHGRASPLNHGSYCDPGKTITAGFGCSSTSSAGLKRLALVGCIHIQQAKLLSTSPPQGDDKGVHKQEGDVGEIAPAPHFRRTGIEKKAEEEAKSKELEKDEDGQYLLPHPIWSEREVQGVEVTHKKPEGFVDWFAYSCVQTMRFSFDLISGYKRGVRSESKWLIRIIFLETVAGVPGMVAAMTRHLRSLRKLQRDHGWIHTLLEEAENERMHLMTALELRKPGKLFMFGVLLTQGISVNLFFFAYLCSPRFCHRFVGYLEEEAVITYTKLIKDLDDGKLKVWGNMAAPDLAVRYWKLKPDALMRDMMLAIRADEAHHREVNHSLSDLKSDDSNPFPPGQ